MSNFFRDTGYVAIGLVLSGIAGLLMNIFLGRVMPAEEYGVFRIFFSSVLLVSTLFSYGIERNITSRLSKGNDERILGDSLTALSILPLLFTFSVVIAQPILHTLLGNNWLIVMFWAAGLFSICYRTTMGIFKGKDKTKVIGWQNTVIGVGKLILTLATIQLGLMAASVAESLTLLFISMTVISVYWARSLLPSSYLLGKPERETLENILYYSFKPIGEVMILFSGPVLVKLLGGTNVEAGIFGALITVAVIPYYGYQAVLHTSLPEITKLYENNKTENIEKLTSMLTEITLIATVIWTIVGFKIGPTMLRTLFQPSFKITATSSMLVFYMIGILLLGSLFTEILIGIDAEIALGISWTGGLLGLFALSLQIPPVMAVSVSLSTYMTIATTSLAFFMYRNGINFTLIRPNSAVFTDE